MSKFSIPLERIAGDMKLDLETVARKITFDLFSKVNLRSPVGNPDLWRDPPPPGYVGGRFRANWNVSYGTPDVSVTDNTNQARAMSEVGKALTLPVGGVTWMANGLPYAQRLEYGYSQQAPAGMVRISVAEFSDIVRRASA